MEFSSQNEKEHKEFKEHIKSIEIKNKIKLIAINNISDEIKLLDEKLEKEIREITLKYEADQLPLYEKINEIVEGKRHPNENELKTVDYYLSEEEKSKKSSALEASPIKDYWFTALKNCEPIGIEIRDSDNVPLKYLTKIEYARINNSYDFIIRFHFDENPYFKNKILTKLFNMIDDETPIKSIGIVIEWKEGMNLTRKKVLKKQKNKKTGHVKHIEKEVENESFFNFFKNTESAANEETDPDIEELMNNHFDMARIIIDDAIPNSLDYYLGIKLGVENDDEFEDEDEDDDEDGDEESESESKSKSFKKEKNKKPHHNENKKHHHHSSRKTSGASGQEEKEKDVKKVSDGEAMKNASQQCKQQ